MKNISKKSILVLSGIILSRGFAGGGVNMTASLFLVPVSKQFDIGIGTLSIYLSIASFVSIIYLPIAGKLLGKYSIKNLVIISTLLQGLSCVGFSLSNNVYIWYLLAIPLAMGGCILVNLMGPVLIGRWFPKNTGLFLGIQMAFVWIFAAILQPVTTFLIEKTGWRTAYIFIGISSIAACVISALFLLSDYPEKISSSMSKKDTAKDSASVCTQSESVEESEKEALKSVSFYLLIIFMITMTGASVFTQHIPTYANLLNYTSSNVGFAMAVVSAGSAVGAIATGFINDKIGPLKSCYAIIFIWALAIIGFIFAKQSFIVFLVCSFLHGVSISSVSVISPTFTMVLFGKKDYEKIFAKVSIGAPVASILLIPAYGFIYDLTSSYFPVLIMMLILLFFAVLSIFAASKKCTPKQISALKKS